ncbi:MAG: lamin tail domain-containing protein [Planctomycetes bacterium]|nr:lamin tail domain-containing protein [Planctomycetota bacterium]
MRKTLLRMFKGLAGVSLAVGLAIAQPAWGALVINEIDANQTGTDTTEFVEISNNGGAAVDFAATPHVVVFFNGSSTNSYASFDLNSGTLAAGEYLVLGNNDVMPAPDILLCASAGCANTLQNGEDAVGLYTGTTASFPSGTAATTVNLVDAIVYTDAGSGTGGPALETALGLNPGDLVDGGAFGNALTSGISRIPDGTGPFTAGSQLTPGATNGAAAPEALGKMTVTQTATTTAAIDLCARFGDGAYQFTISTLPTNGTLLDGGAAFAVPHVVTGLLTYDPDTGPDFSGVDTFDFSVTDGNGAGLTSAIVTQEIAVQLVGSVYISEVMHTPSGDQRAFEFIEIYNGSGSPVSLGSIDATASLDTNFSRPTAGNLVGMTIAANSIAFIATDVTTAGIVGVDNESLRCDWNFNEADIFRIPLELYETMFAISGADCGTANGSRILLFAANGDLLDAVDLGRPGGAAPNCVGQSYALDPFPFDIFNVTPDSAENDNDGNWNCVASVGGISEGLEIGDATTDTANPGYILSTIPSASYVFDPACFGACCLPDGSCVEGLKEAECLVDNCGISFTQGSMCNAVVCNAVATNKCCLPIGTCAELTECECLLAGGDFDGGANCTFLPNECPVEVSLVINELEYNTPGSDTADALEFVELFSPIGGGQSAAGWKLEFYNGNDTTGTNLYNTIDLSTIASGMIPLDGYLVAGDVNVANVDIIKSGAIQNGGGRGDGVVLSFSGIVVEALSYGQDIGTSGFTAVGGDADGTFLPDILVADSSATSLQKIPDGGTFTSTLNNTPGETNFDAGNFGACCDGLTCSLDTQATCTSNGFAYQGDGTNCDFNPCLPRGACCNPDGTCTDNVDQAVCENILGGSWNGDNTLCNDYEAFEACLDGPGAPLATGCDPQDLDGASPADVDLADFALFQVNTCAPAATGACCPPDGVCVEISQFDCAADGGDYRGDGVVCAGLIPVCTPPTPGDVLINEIWADDPGADDVEFIELFGTAGVNLAGRSLIIIDGDTAGDVTASQYRSVTMQIDFTALDVLGGTGFLLVGTGANIGTIDVDLDALGGNANAAADDIQNGSQTYALVPTADIAFCTSVGLPDASCNGAGTQLTAASEAALTANAFDAVATLDGSVGDHRYLVGAAPLVQDNGFAIDHGHRIPNGVDTDGSGDWETQFGFERTNPVDPADPSTPGATNSSQSLIAGSCCQGVDEQECKVLTEAACITSNGTFNGPGTSCGLLPEDNPCSCGNIGSKPVLAFPAQLPTCLVDIVISSDVDSASSGTLRTIYAQDIVGTNGLVIFGNNADVDALLLVAAAGDRVKLRGTLQAFFDEQEIIAPFQIEVIESGFGIPTPFPKQINQMNVPINVGVNDDVISTLVVLKNVTITGGGAANWVSGNTTVTGVGPLAAETWAVRLSGDNTLVGTPIPAGAVDIVGVVTTFSGNFNLKPRSPADITPTVP